MGNKIEKDKKPNTWLYWWAGIAAFVCIVIVLLVNWYLLHDRIASDSLNDRGTYGDMFGVSNAFFSGIAFAGIVITIWMQKDELILQRKELSETREVLKHQANHLQQQSETLIAQKEENTFFQLLKLHNDIIEGASFQRLTKDQYKGRDAFRKLSFWVLKGVLDCITTSADATRIGRCYLLVYKEYSSVLGHYFRLLYQIVRFVDDMKIEDEQKHLYTGIISAQLSQVEMELIYLNCLSNKTGVGKFKPLVEKYGLLKAMPFNSLARLGDEETLKSYYSPAAFGEPVK
jgi:hypothetical protein